MKNFDELFNEFFNENKKNKDNKHIFERIINPLINSKKEDISDGETMINDIMSLFNTSESFTNEELRDKIISKVGIPNRVDSFITNDVYHEIVTWETESVGDIVITFKSPNIDKPIFKGFFEKELSLEEQLREAVENENYEEAAILRDMINEEKMKT